MDEEINIGVVGIGKMSIYIPKNSLNGVEVKAIGDKQGLILSFIRGAISIFQK